MSTPQPQPGDWDTPFRYIRGEKGGYEEAHFKTREQRDTAGKAYAKSDGEDVLLEFCDEEGRWWLEEVAYAPGNEPAPVDYSKRFNADAALPGDTVTLFGCPAPEGWDGPSVWGTGRTVNEHRNTEHTGAITRKKPITLFGTVASGLRFEFADGRVIDCIAHAVTTMHELGNNVTKES